MTTKLKAVKDSGESAIATKIQGTPNSTITALENLISHLPQADIPLDHFFSDGLYGRKMTMPASALLVGKTHKHNHFAILLKGEVAVTSRQGRALFVAPYVFNVVAGDKRAFFSVTEVEWLTIHATDETDIKVLEDTLVD